MAKSKQKQNFSTQLIWLVLVFVVLVSISALSTLVVTGNIELVPEKGEPVGYIGDAENICDKTIREEHGNNINAFAVDDHSSRMDEGSGQYKLYYTLTLYEGSSQKSGVKDFFVNCFVSASRGVVSRVEYLEQKDFKPKVIRREHGNVFGF